MTATCFDLDLGHNYALYHGDSIQVLPGLPDHSVGLSVSSWPFSDQYAYSDSIADLGNCCAGKRRAATARRATGAAGPMPGARSYGFRPPA